MGATSTHKPSSVTPRQFLKERVTFSGATILDVATVGTNPKEAYFLTRHDDGFVTIYACTYTTGPMYKGDPDNFGWRDPWGEQHGIHEIRCPEAFLRRLSPLPDAPDPDGAAQARRALEEWEAQYYAHLNAVNDARSALNELHRRGAAHADIRAAEQAVTELERATPSRAEQDALRAQLRAADPFAPHREWRDRAWAAARRAKAFTPGTTVRFATRLRAAGEHFQTVTLLRREAQRMLGRTDSGETVSIPMDARHWMFDVVTPAPDA